MDELVRLIADSLREGTFAALVLSNPSEKSETRPRSIRIRPVEHRTGLRYQWSFRFAQRETHENLTSDESLQRLPLELNRYRQAHLMTAQADYLARPDRDGCWRWKASPATRKASVQPHNRAKAYLIPEGSPCPFLEAVGVMTPEGKVRASARAKFRQINRYLEFVEDIYEHLPAEGPISVVDFGCGKSYLTFALYHLLANVHGREVRIVGLDRRADVIATCSELARRLHMEGLEFRVGEIATHQATGDVHLAVSLHACDTATDDALAQAAAWNADVIFAVPCCQHEIAGKMTAPPELMTYGILKERFAAIVTDAIRAAALEGVGYRTQVLEFINMEHTAKNVLIRGVRRPDGARSPAALDRFARLKSLVGVRRTYLESVLPLPQE